MNFVKRHTLTAVSVLGLLWFSSTVWPTCYRYSEVRRSNSVFPVRISRIDGTTEIFSGEEWISEKPAPGILIGKQLPDSAAGKVTGTASGLFGNFHGTIYNGSEWTLTEVRFQIWGKDDAGKEKWNREFLERISIPPLSAREFDFDVVQGGAESTTWTIRAVYGLQD
jgi:hypothetical protein